MIFIPQNELTRRLQSIKPKDSEDPEAVAAAAKEHDEILANAWKSLDGAAKNALDYFLAQLEAQTVEFLQRPNVSPDQRQFCAGQLNVLYTIQAGIQRFQNFDASEYDYKPEFGDPDAAGGPDDPDIVY